MRVWTAAFVMAAAALAAPPRVAAGPGPDLSVKALVSKASSYVAGYESALSFVLADETSEQHVRADGEEPQDRIMHGELFLTYLVSDRHWIAVHDIADVDGVPVPDRDSLPSLLSRDSVSSVARRLVERNARYNIGRAVRNFSEPTLPLAIFEPKRIEDFKFSRGDVDRQDPGATLVTLQFREHGPLTLVRGLSGEPAPSRGEVVIEADTGRIRRTTMAVDDRHVAAELETTYTYNEKLDLWVPSRFTERYAGKERNQEITTCESSYTNYRRFETHGRIVP